MAENSTEMPTPESKPPQAPPPPRPAPPVAAPPPWWPRQPRRSVLGRLFSTFLALVFLVSVVVNVYLLAYVVILSASPFETVTLREGKKEQTVAVYKVSGFLGDGAVEDFESFSREVLDEKNVKAVVLRVDSGGGSVSASDQIHATVQRLKDRGRKVVVSMGGVAASGGYYISAAADEIVAEPTTHTGSIGVIAVWPVIKRTLDKYGVDLVVIKSRHAEEWKDEGTILDMPTPKHREHIQEALDRLQSRFEQIVVEGRGKKLKPYRPREGAGPTTQPAPEFEAANGKIYGADEARQQGLVDAIGYRQDAIDRAASLAGLSKPKVVLYRKRKSLRAQLFESESVRGLQLDPGRLDELLSPRLLFAWRPD